MTHWGPGWIPQDCKQMTLDAKLNPADVETYTVHYDDCGDPWILCRHKDSPSPLTNLIDRFGRLPVQTREWVRHVIALPDSFGHAYNQDGNIAMFNIIDDLGVFVHESGHSLDLLGAYADSPLSSSTKWINEYNQDSAVPDPYAQSNQVENVAQNTVVASFNENVAGGFATVEPDWGNIFHQFATIITEAKNAGGLLNPEEKAACTHRLTNSAPVSQSSSSRIMARSLVGDMPDVSLSGDVKVIPPKQFHTGEACQRTWGCNTKAKDPRGDTPLLWAAADSLPKVVEVLLNESAGINTRNDHGETGLHKAPRNFQFVHPDAHGKFINPPLEVVKLLLDRSVDGAVNDKDGTTALHRAVPNDGVLPTSSEGSSEVVRLLLARGGDATAQDFERETALHRAAYSAIRPILRLLLDNGADIDARKDDGRTAVLETVSSAHKLSIASDAAAKLLLDRCADVEVKKKDGRTALHVAVLSIAKSLLKAVSQTVVPLLNRCRHRGQGRQWRNCAAFGCQGGLH
ncbi:MAG: hypothetical protein M1830_009135 [Pleopsidium flavum]|nr:MAG: hypothetical protein M1830_009135 [Pleopsidium flavum]